MRGRLQQAVHDGHQARGRRDRPRHVDPAAVTRHVDPAAVSRHPALRQHARHHDQREQYDRDVDEEDPPPGRQAGQRPGDDRAERPAQAGDAAPDPQGLHPLAGVGEQHGDHAERRRGGQRLPRALHEPAGDQHGRGNRGATRRRRDPEDEHADQEQPPPAEQVRQPPAQEQQAAGHQHVTVDHPGQARAGERQIVLDPRQGDGHHRDVQDEHELDQRQHAKRPPSPRVRTGGPGRRTVRILACDAHESCLLVTSAGCGGSIR